MRYPSRGVGAALIGCVLAGPALAADPVAAATTTATAPRGPATAPVQAVTQRPEPGWVIPHAFVVFGTPVRLSAPVLPPYDNSSFRTIGGQPATGADAQMAQDK